MIYSGDEICQMVDKRNAIKKCESIRMDSTLNAETKVYLIARELKAVDMLNIDLYYSILELKEKYFKNIQRFEYDTEV